MTAEERLADLRKQFQQGEQREEPVYVDPVVQETDCGQ
jgi:hypothetical protein